MAIVIFIIRGAADRRAATCVHDRTIRTRRRHRRFKDSFFFLFIIYYHYYHYESQTRYIRAANAPGDVLKSLDLSTRSRHEPRPQ